MQVCVLLFPLNRTANSSVFNTDKVASENAFCLRVLLLLSLALFCIKHTNNIWHNIANLTKTTVLIIVISARYLQTKWTLTVCKLFVLCNK